MNIAYSPAEPISISPAGLILYIKPTSRKLEIRYFNCFFDVRTAGINKKQKASHNSNCTYFGGVSGGGRGALWRAITQQENKMLETSPNCDCGKGFGGSRRLRPEAQTIKQISTESYQNQHRKTSSSAPNSSKSAPHCAQRFCTTFGVHHRHSSRLPTYIPTSSSVPKSLSQS